LNIKKNTTKDVGNRVPGSGQAQNVTEIKIPSLHNLSIARVMFRFGRVFLHIVCTEVF
jgi:hypothetical protein